MIVWFQDRDCVHVTICKPSNTAHEIVLNTADGLHVALSDRPAPLQFEWLHPVDPGTLKVRAGANGQVFIDVQKAEPGVEWVRCCRQRQPWVTVDWKNWLPSEEWPKTRRSTSMAFPGRNVMIKPEKLVAL